MEMYWVGWLHHTVLWWISPTLRLTFILKSLLAVSLSLSSRGKKIWVDIKCWYTHLGQLQLLPCAQSSMLNEQEQHGIFFCPGFCFPGCTVRMAYFTGEDFFFFPLFWAVHIEYLQNDSGLKKCTVSLISWLKNTLNLFIYVYIIYI